MPLLTSSYFTDLQLFMQVYAVNLVLLFLSNLSSMCLDAYPLSTCAHIVVLSFVEASIEHHCSGPQDSEGACCGETDCQHQ